MPLPSRIYLTGFMGSGKSTVGPIVANVLGYDFTDLDTWIAEHAGRSIPELFEAEGEAAFRARETTALRASAGWGRTVVALGGGTLARAENLEVARRQGLVVYLYVAPTRLAARLTRSPTPRPMLCDASGQRLGPVAMRRRVANLLGEREAFYRQAHLTVDTTGLRIGPTVDTVARAIQAHVRKN